MGEVKMSEREWRRRWWGLLRYVEEGERFPEWFGIAWPCLEVRGCWAAPLGVNLLLRWARVVWVYVMRAWPIPRVTAGENALSQRIEPLVRHAVQIDRERAAGLVRQYGLLTRANPELVAELSEQVLKGRSYFHIDLDLRQRAEWWERHSQAALGHGTQTEEKAGGLETRPTGSLMPDARCPMPDARCPMPDP